MSGSPSPTVAVVRWIAGALILLSPAAYAEAQGNTQPWKLFGTNELAVSNYSVDGNTNASAFRNTGTFWSDRLSLNLERDAGRGRTLKVHLGFLVGKDDYLAVDGAVLETLKVSFEDGTTGLPYRFEAGDAFTDFSRRSLQTTVRGVTLELQPQTSAGQSLVFTSGSGERSWDNTFDGDSGSLYYNGLSYLLSSAAGTMTMVANFVNTRQETPLVAQPLDGSAATFRTDTNVGSVYGETWLGKFFLEGELAYLSGTRAEEDIDGSSFYAQVSRNGGPLSWRVRYEDNGEDYRTPGAVGVIADRRIGEFHGRYAFGRPGTIRGRAQFIKTRVAQPVPTRSDLYAVSYDGRPLRARNTMSFRASADFNDTRAEDDSSAFLFTNFAIGVNDRIGAFTLGYRLAVRDQDNKVVAAAGRRMIDNSFNAGRPFSAAGARMNLRGGLVFRSQSTSSEYDQWSPTIDFSANWTRHRFGIHWSFLDQNFVLATVADLRYQNQRVTYAFEYDAHTLSFELYRELRQPDLADNTDSLRLRFAYRYAFDRAW